MKTELNNDVAITLPAADIPGPFVDVDGVQRALGREPTDFAEDVPFESKQWVKLLNIRVLAENPCVC